MTEILRDADLNFNFHFFLERIKKEMKIGRVR